MAISVSFVLSTVSRKKRNKNKMMYHWIKFLLFVQLTVGCEKYCCLSASTCRDLFDLFVQLTVGLNVAST
jgi:hypothetical protein